MFPVCNVIYAFHEKSSGPIWVLPKFTFLFFHCWDFQMQRIPRKKTCWCIKGAYGQSKELGPQKVFQKLAWGSGWKKQIGVGRWIKERNNRANRRFLSNHYPFLLEGIGANNFGPFPFQAQVHLKMVQKFFPLDVVACVPPFMFVAKTG